MKKSIKESLITNIAVILALAMITAISIYPKIQLNREKSKFFHLEDYIEAVEDGMRGFNDYYVVVCAEENGLMHDMGGCEAVYGDIRLVVPKGTSHKLVVQFYTGWDELIGTFLCDFDKMLGT